MFGERTIAGGGSPRIERRPDDYVARIGKNDALRFNLGFRVKVQRIDGIGFRVVALATVKDQISGEQNQSGLRTKLGQLSGHLDVYLAGEFRKSIADCDEVLKRNPGHFGALSGLGEIYLQLEDDVKALEWYRRALEVNPNMVGVEMKIRMLEERRKAPPAPGRST